MFVILNMTYSTKIAETMSVLHSEAQSSFAPVETAKSCGTLFSQQ